MMDFDSIRQFAYAMVTDVRNFKLALTMWEMDRDPLLLEELMLIGLSLQMPKLDTIQYVATWDCLLVGLDEVKRSIKFVQCSKDYYANQVTSEYTYAYSVCLHTDAEMTLFQMIELPSTMVDIIAQERAMEMENFIWQDIDYNQARRDTKAALEESVRVCYARFFARILSRFAQNFANAYL